ncbi:endocuticle structural glycoprotein SgAbd-5-like [Aricia agestis]|uniref:endocuticle structural glycoprotein SgAbd-5-like n=1 Tax=Aricia agestis TaxID=91739 RepID=UPI001C2041D3|nr:endocuticle structural glycoprotein SgAbd-5-like [Aricia agestis]
MLSVYLGISFMATSFVLAPVDTAPVQQDERESDILYYENISDGKGNYGFSFGTADNTRREETGQIVNAGQPDEHIEVNGSYSYFRPDGEEEIVYYVADKDGFRTVPKPERPLTAVLAGIPTAVLASLAG